MLRTLAAMVIGAISVKALADPPADTAQPPETTESATADIYIYTSHGQSDKQLDRDRDECHNWAVAQSHYNPSDPHLAPHQQIQVVAVPDPPPRDDTVVGAMA